MIETKYVVSSSINKGSGCGVLPSKVPVILLKPHGSRLSGDSGVAKGDAAAYFS